MELHDALRILRKLRDLPVLQLSKRSGVSRGYIDRIESGEATIDNVSYMVINKLADALEVPVDMLVGHQPIPGYSERAGVIADLEEGAKTANPRLAEILRHLAAEIRDSEDRWIEYMRASGLTNDC